MWTRGHLLQTDPGHQSSPAITTSACMCTHTRARTHTHTHTNSCWHEELTAPGRGWLMLVNHWGLDPPHMVLRYIHIRAKVGVLAVVHSFPLYLWLSRSLAICLVPDTSVIHGLALMMTTSMLMPITRCFVNAQHQLLYQGINLSEMCEQDSVCSCWKRGKTMFCVLLDSQPGDPGSSSEHYQSLPLPTWIQHEEAWAIPRMQTSSCSSCRGHLVFVYLPSPSLRTCSSPHVNPVMLKRAAKDSGQLPWFWPQQLAQKWANWNPCLRFYFPYWAGRQRSFESQSYKDMNKRLATWRKHVCRREEWSQDRAKYLRDI